MNIRPMVESDLNFILSTWLKSYYEELKRNGSKGVIYPKDDVFFQGHQIQIKKRLEDAKEINGALVCTAPDDDNQIIGWIVFQFECIHYCYVKQVFRKMGVAKELRKKAANAKYYSHHTRYSRHLNQGLAYDPYKF